MAQGRKRRGWRRAATAAALLAAAAGVARAADALPGAPLLDKYCVACHNTIDWAGGVSFDGVTAATVAAEPEVWEAAVRKIRTGMMPPPGEPRPARDALDRFAGQLETRLDVLARQSPDPGTKSLHRLNRTEYANAIRDLLAYDADVTTLLPADDSAEGFDNMADVLGVSPTLVQSYVSAAMKISRAAVGDPAMKPVTVKLAAPAGAAQRDHVEGLPLGSRGGLRVVHFFPVDGEYEFRVATGGGFRLSGPESGLPPKFEVLLNGEPQKVPDVRRFRLRVKAGPQVLAVAIIERQHSDGVDEFYARTPPRRDAVQGVTIQGPFDVTGVGDTPSRRAILLCRPENEAAQRPCARQIVAHLADRAFRGHFDPVDGSLDPLMAAYDAGAAEGGFESGIQHAVARLLVDPRFLYRIESDRDDVPAGTPFRISDVELASRLSFFLWSSVPDDPLLSEARAGRLHQPATLEREVRRMLADPRAKRMADGFAGQWLHLRELANTQPLDAAFDDTLRSAFESETRLLFASVVDGNRPVTDLLDADYTFLNEPLAKHYGIDGVRGSYLRRVALPPDSPRRGLLGQGSILTVTSAGNRTSPVKRGAWVLETLLGTPVPQPPPGVEADLKEGAPGAQPTSVRERLELHRANASCAACHRVMDPIGFTLENFDLVGRWRTTDAGTPVNAADTLADGTPVNGVIELRRALLSRSDAFVTGFTEKLMTYALGRRLGHHDQPAIRQIVRDARGDGNRFVPIVLGIVRSAPFQMRRRPPPSDPRPTSAPVSVTSAAH
jgi:hypothetical protein